MNRTTAGWIMIAALALCAAVLSGFSLYRATTRNEPPEPPLKSTARTVIHSGLAPRAVSPAFGKSSRHTRKAAESDMTALRLRLETLSAEDSILLLDNLAKTEPKAALELAMGLGTNADRSGTAREILRALARRDLAGAIQWGESRPAAPEMETFWAAIVDLTCGPDPASAFGHSQKTSGALRLQLLEDVFSEWAGEDIAAAKAAAASMTNPDERLASHLAILPSEIERDPGQTIRWIESITDPLLQDMLYYHSVRSWSDNDPVAAAAFVSEQVESDFKTHVAGALVESWVRKDASAAITWASSLPEQESREQAISAGLKVIMETSIQQAADLALLLPIEGDRSAAIESIVSHWIEQDPAALQKWIPHVPDQTMKESLQRMVKDHFRHEK